jgi:hypothetical protein
MSFVLLGASLEADKRIRMYETKMRLEKRLRRDRILWQSYEEDFEKPRKDE